MISQVISLPSRIAPAAFQTFTYDTRNRELSYDWNDASTASRYLSYDDASRTSSCNTDNTWINLTYYNDNTLKSQEEWTGYYGDNIHRTITYTYDADGNRATADLPGILGLAYDYTGRNQPWKVTNTGTGNLYATYGYDPNGNLTSRWLNNSTTSSFVYDAVDRVTDITHNFANSTVKTFHYGYDAVGNRTSVQRDGGTADAIVYDKNNQMTSFGFNGATSTLNYDASGNRSSVVSGGTTTTYGVNGLNQYSSVGSLSPTYSNGNLKTYDGWVYTYDAMNRLTAVDGPGGVYADFYYDGLGRQVARGVSWTPTRTISVWDGPELYAECNAGGSWSSVPVHGAPGDLLEELRPTGVRPFFYRDGLGSTSHVADSSGNLIEKYTYDLAGAPTFYDAANNPRDPNATAFGITQLFTGQKWYSQLSGAQGLYDLHNRAYLPNLGRFLQPDPIGFSGDPANLYRYCANNPVNKSDPTGEGVEMIGGSFNFGIATMTSLTAQVGASYSIFTNPLDWSIGYNVSYVDFGKSWTTYSGWGVSVVRTVAPFADSISSLGTAGSTSESSGLGGPVSPGSPVSVSADVGWWTDGNQPTISTAITFGSPTDRAGANLYTQSETVSSGEVSLRSIWNTVVNFFGSIFSTSSNSTNSGGGVVSVIAPFGGPPQYLQPANTTIIQP